jgi:undecaprenyl-diphosphatase
MRQTMTLVSLPGEIVPLLLSVALLVLWGLYHRRYQLTAWFAGVNLSAFLIVTFIKNLTAIPRPLGALAWGYSFPSGHTASYVVFWGTLIYWIHTSNKSKWLKDAVYVLGAVLILLVGYSRVYLGEHWIVDVVGGYILGIIILCVSIFIELRSKLLK